MILWGRAGLLLGVLAHAGGGSCAHVPSGGSHFSGGSPHFSSAPRVAAAPRAAPIEMRPSPHVGHAGAEAAAAVFDAALETIASAPSGPVGDAPEAAGGGDEGPGPLQPPDILLCVTTAECGPGGACDRVTRSMQFARSGEAVGLCRAACRTAADCLAHERCLENIDGAGAAVGGCVPEP